MSTWHCGEVAKLVLFLSLCQFVGSVSASEPLSPELEAVIVKHESQIASLISGKCEWTLAGFNANGTQSSEPERYETVFGPGFERTSWQRSDGQHHVQWDGKHLLSVRGEISAVADDPRNAELLKGERYGEDSCLLHTFDWRTGRSYRVFASDRSRSLRELCVESLETPIITENNKFVEIRLVSNGALELDKLVCEGGIINLQIDKEKGYCLSRYTTNCGDDMVISLSFLEHDQEDDVYIPTRVRFDYSAQEGSSYDEMQLKFSDINQIEEPLAPFFPENVLVRDMPRPGDDATAFYVVRKNGNMGEPFREEVDAADARFYRISQALANTSFASRHPRILTFVVSNLFIFAVVYSYLKFRHRQKT
ncbi:hypothetical protein N9N28_10770 [Rubripirellula amarantea]|nr:hypothetical protein [Rubripirellula amarantea]